MSDTPKTDDGACDVPLIEQLRSIPKDYRTVRATQWDEAGNETGHQFIPVGYMMHRAADELSTIREEGRQAGLEEARKWYESFLNRAPKSSKERPA